MATKVIMPALGLAQETGVLLKWFKKEGEQVTKGEPLIEIETDKATVEVEANASGILAHVTAAPGDEVPVGEQIALILAPGETAGEQGTRSGGAGEMEVQGGEEARRRGKEDAERRRGEEVQKQLPSASSPHRVPGSPPPRTITPSPLAARIAAEHNVDLSQIKPDGNRIQKADVLNYLETTASGGQRSVVGGLLPASPKARRLARERGVDLGTIEGHGPDGAVLAKDVLLALEADRAAVPAGEIEPATGKTVAVSPAWRVMVERLTQSWTTVPHFYLLREVEASRLITWRAAAQKNSAEKITYTDLLVRVVAAALRQHPRLNAAWQEGAIGLNEEVNIGLAVATSDGLVVPVIHRADTLTLAELAVRRQDVVSRANEGKLKLTNLQGGTFTLSNLGMYGVDAFNAIINPPQAAILAVSRIADRVVPVNGQPAVRPMLTLTLSCDHRVVDGARAAQFLDTLAGLIEEPLGLIN